MENKEKVSSNEEEKVFSSENPEERSDQPEAAVEDFKEEGKRQMAEVREKGTAEDFEEMTEAAREANTGAEEAKDAYITESEEEKKIKMEILENFFKKNKARIEEVTERLYSKLGEAVDSEQVMSGLAGFLKDEKFLRKLEEEGIITEDMYRAAVTASPVIEEAIRKGEEEGREEMVVMEKARREIIGILAETDAGKDSERIAAAGKMLLLLVESGKIADKRVCLVLKAVGTALHYEIVQNTISKKFRDWLEKERQEGKEDEQIAETFLEETGY